jgi:hypothetical protein
MPSAQLADKVIESTLPQCGKRLARNDDVGQCVILGAGLNFRFTPC